MTSYRRTAFRGQVQTVDVARFLKVDCPDCGAAVGGRCFKLSSWVVERVPLKGFYTARIETPHLARRKASRRDQPPVPQDRGELRRQISAAAQRKLPGNARMDVRRWAGSVARTVPELAARLAELEAMPDLAW